MNDEQAQIDAQTEIDEAEGQIADFLAGVKLLAAEHGIAGIAIAATVLTGSGEVVVGTGNKGTELHLARLGRLVYDTYTAPVVRELSLPPVEGGEVAR